ncbi:Uu.00g059080.m01.CDS01 [Anthostomella pinea]|uniref:Uu.00g059080.m01.CDS01 n=1 Tax=Anthostomella pinea TaxID=933095 RepID=A0AAI8YM74_9PEZI|nr:Uu.00g059080.m01.CDS01 [Anthostomella pinea]
MATAVEANGAASGELEDDISRNAIQPLDPTNNGLESLNMRADPDAQATVTDYLDFTEYLPSDMMRSLTLIGQLDHTYIDASSNVDQLTTTWGTLPTFAADQRPDPIKLRADISDNLNRAVSSRVYSHAEACRMQENVNRHHNRAKTILAKLQTILDNYPTTEEQKVPVQSKSPQMVRAPKITLRVDSNGQKVRQPPRITVPGEVLAPYEMDFNAYSSSSGESSEDEIAVSPPRQTTTPAPRIKLVKTPKPPKQPKVQKPPRPSVSRPTDNANPPLSTSTALAALKPPPENAVAGSSDAPWLQLTPYELAKLRKRMKKNAVWCPSDTMIARELKVLGRGVEAYKTAQKQAEDEGKPFDAALPTPIFDAESGAQHAPPGAISAEALTADEVQLSNRGMKLNEAKKLKRDIMAKQAAEEAEEAARNFAETARGLFVNEASPSVAGSAQEKSQETGLSQAKAQSKSKARKRKRDSVSETPVTEKPQGAESQTPQQATAQPPSQSDKPQLKRTKTETPVPLPQLTPRPPSVPPLPALATAPSVPTETPVPIPQLGKTAHTPITSKTPVPVPTPVLLSIDPSLAAVKPPASSSGQTSPASSTVTTIVPTKPAAERSVQLPMKTSTTPIPPPIREMPKRETRQNLQPTATNPKQPASRGNTPIPAPGSTSSASAPTPAHEPQPQPQPTPTSAHTPAHAPVPVPLPARRPTSRGKAASQEPAPTLAAERPRRASTARNTPAPEVRQPSKRTKRPAPGVVTTNSGGTSAIGKRKAAPRKKARGPKKDKGANPQPEQEVEVEVDDDGNVVDPNEPRYCLCNRVSFGTMIHQLMPEMASSSTYTPAYPTNVAIDGRVKDFIADFYATSDDPSKNEEWVDFFATDAVLVMGEKAARGTEEIREVRKGMWEKVKSRKHKPERVFPASVAAGSDDGGGGGRGDAYEYMLCGSLDFVMKTGEDVVATWAGRAALREVGGVLKYDFYQVYLHN